MSQTIQQPLTVAPQSPSPSGEGLRVAERETQALTTQQLPTVTKLDQVQPINVLELFEYFTDKVTSVKDAQTYLEFRSELLETLKRCQKSLEIYEARTFIPLLAKEQTDTLNFGKYEVNYKPSSKRAIDMKKLQAAITDPEILNQLLKKPEFKSMHQCREILFKHGIYSDVYTTKIGKKPILHIIDTNTIKRTLEEAEGEDEHEE